VLDEGDIALLKTYVGAGRVPCSRARRSEHEPAPMDDTYRDKAPMPRS
jgi:hypothetical protein